MFHAWLPYKPSFLALLHLNAVVSCIWAYDLGSIKSVSTIPPRYAFMQNNSSHA